MRVDNFSLVMHQACPSKYDLRIRQGWQTKHKSAALTFGGAFHAGVAEWYRTGDLQQTVDCVRAAWDAEVPIEDYRTLPKCIEVLLSYIKQYPNENFTFVGAPEHPLIEVAFTLPLVTTDGKQLRCDDGEPIEYGGIFDGLVEFGQMVYVLEHKTTSQLTPWFFNQFKPNNQVTGYVWAGGILSGKRVGGAIVNAIGLTKSGRITFDRQLTTRSPEEIDRWALDVQATCNEIKTHERTGHWPWRTTSCTQYGLCEFHRVHVIPDVETQMRKLEQDYFFNPWNYEERDTVPSDQ